MQTHVHLIVPLLVILLAQFGCCHRRRFPAVAVAHQDIYIARAEGELQLEEELFYLLLKVFKSPALLNTLTQQTA